MRAERARQALLVVGLATLGVAMLTAQRGAPPPGVPTPGGAQAPRGAAPPAVTGTAAISGVVIDGTTKQPLPGAIVQITGGARGAAQQPRVISDSKGRFVFRNLGAFANYDFAVTKSGYISTPTRVGDSSDQIPLADGEWIADLVLPLWRLSSISGTVVDERGEPVVGVPVKALARLPAAGTVHLASSAATQTDDKGGYRIAGLRAGNYVILIPSVQAAVPITTPVALIAGRSQLPAPETGAGRISGVTNMSGINIGDTRLVIGNFATPPPLDGRPQSYPTIFYPGLRSPTRAPSIVLGYGEEREGVDFSLQPVTAAAVNGRVIGPAASWAGLVLRLLVDGGEELGLGLEQATALVRADGSFSFLSVPTGSYTLEAKRSFGELTVGGSFGPGLSGTPGVVSPSTSATQVTSTPPGVTVIVRQTTGEERYWGRQRIVVNTTGASNVTVALQPTASVRGRVMIDGPPRPVSVFSLVVEPAGGEGSKGVSRIPPPTLAQTPQGASDEFSFHGLTDGEYFLRYYSQTMAAKSIMVNGVDYVDRPFDASRGDLTGVVVTVTDKLARLSGTVRDRRGAVVANAAVIVFPADRTQWTRYGFSPPRIKSTLASRQGSYSVQGLPHGDYLAVAVTGSQRESWQDSRFFPAVAGTSSRVSLDWGATQTADLILTEVTLR